MPPARMARTSKGRLWNSGQKETRQGCDPDGLNRGPLQRKSLVPPGRRCLTRNFGAWGRHDLESHRVKESKPKPGGVSSVLVREAAVREADLSQKIDGRSSGNEKGERRWLTLPFPSQAMALGWPP